MRWRLLIVEFGPELRYIKGEQNIVADVLSRLQLKEEEFSLDAFAFDDEDFPSKFPLSYKQLSHEQKKSKDLQNKVTKGTYRKETREHSSHSYELVVDKDGKIVIPAKLRQKGVEWYHEQLCHPGETRTEATLRQHFSFPGLKTTVNKVCKACAACQYFKKHKKKYGKIPPKKAEDCPWKTLAIDLIGPYVIGTPATKTKESTEVTLWALTMIDPATGWFDIREIPTKQADYIANYLEFTWLSRYPWPTEVVMDRGKEFAAEVKDALRNEYGINLKVITTRNPQANGICERVNGKISEMIRTFNIQQRDDLDPRWGFEGILSAVRRGVNATVHTTLRATPTQLVFGRDAMLNVSFEADWQYIKERKQKRILQNNKAENKTRMDYTFSVGDKVGIKQDPNRKHGKPHNKGPYTVTKVNDNGTVQLREVAPNGGAVSQTWNIRNLFPSGA